jgi:hypothetical protein
MPEEPKEQVRKAFSKQTVKRIKELVKKYDIDTKNCRKKNDYIDAILASDKLSEILKDREFFGSGAEELETIKSEITEVGEDIEKILKQVEEIPNMKDEEADRLISQKKNLDLSLDDLEYNLEQIRMRFEERNYGSALFNSLGVREVASDKMKELERYIWTYTILSAEKIIENCSMIGANTDSVVRLLISAKDVYKKDEILGNRALIEDLQTKASELLKKEVENSRINLEKREKFVEEIKNLGAKVSESEEVLRRGWESIERNDCLGAMEHADKAVELAKATKAVRIEEIKNAIPLTRSLIEEAKQLGSDVTEAEKYLSQAEDALARGDYLLCAELSKRAEQNTIELQSTQIRKAMELRQRQMENISRSIAQIEPQIREAEGYGLNVGNARESLQRAGRALEAHDYVNGTLYIKHAEEILQELEPQMENFRSRREIPKPVGGICSRCKSTNIKFFDNGWGKCISCGAIFRWMDDASGRKEKKGLLGKLFKKE